MQRTCLGLLWLLAGVRADLYMHAPRGSNNKLNEVSNNANNQNRLFDSQNNAAGGYQVGDNCHPVCSNANGNYNKDTPGAGKGQMYYYEGSYVHVEWTNQHGCGAGQKNVKCELVLQYMCDEDGHGDISNTNLRDGTTTNRVPDNEEGAADPQFGLHEPLTWYQNCKHRERNKGLYISDQNLNRNRDRAINTRQNNNGNRRGLECPEERDYYPYWHPTPWRDIAIFSDDMFRCDYYKEHSQNRRNYGACCNETRWRLDRTCIQQDGYDPDDDTPAGPNNRVACSANEAQGYAGLWVEYGHWGTGSPDCERTPFSRDNHLGNSIPKAGENGELFGLTRASSYRWAVPNDVLRRTGRDAVTCVLRMRYNVSTADFDGWGGIDAGSNGENAPLKGNPTGDFTGFTTREELGTEFPLKLNVNTNQYGRTFEDRSHTFQIRRRPGGACHDKKIHNLNVRGRRGNIVQTYPAVEYDFVPNKLEMWEGDCIHFQWAGSDANPPGNAGNGRRMTDRSNIVEIPSLGKNTPMKIGWDLKEQGAQRDAWSLLGSQAFVKKLAYLDQAQNATTGEPTGACDDEQDNEQALDNCKELNAAPGYFDTGPVVMQHAGTIWYMSTRNNDFTNRSQKGTIVIKGWRVFVIVACSLLGLSAMLSAFYYWARKARYDPNHRLHRYKSGRCFVAFSHWATRTYLKSPLRKSPWTVSLVLFCVVLYIVGWWMAGGGPGAKLLDPAPWYVHAKGFGRVLDVLCNLIFLPVLRNFMSWLRTTPLVNLLPLGEEIYFHKVTFVLLLISAIGHIWCHYLDFDWHERFGWGYTFAEQAFLTWSGFSGLIIALCMFIMMVTALERVRRRRWGKGKWSFGGYSMFVRVHKLWVVVLILLWTHSRAFWHYSLAPTMLLIIDKLIGRLRGKVPVVLAAPPTTPARDVLALKMKLTNNRKFRYKSGQYLFLNCPAISTTEWHPFTISSSPEEGHFSVHIRCRPDMDWTYALKSALLPDAKMKRQQEQAKVEEARLEERETTRRTEARQRYKLWQQRLAALQAAVYDLFCGRPKAGRGRILGDEQRREAVPLGGSAASAARTATSADPPSPRLLPPPSALPAPATHQEPVQEGFNFFGLFSAGRDQTTSTTTPSPPPSPPPAPRPADDDEPALEPAALDAALDEEACAVGAAGAVGGGAVQLTWRRPRDEHGVPLAAAAAETLVSISPPASPPAGGVGVIPPPGEVELFVDGPYGSASEEVFAFEVLVLVGAGIGVTPFASILKTLKIQARDGRLETPLKKVAFYWVCRDEREFETFRDLLLDIVDDRSVRTIFELNTYITGELDLKKVREGKEYGYNQFAGRPDWSRIGKELRTTYPTSDIGVFLCGPNAIGQQLVAMCNKYNPKETDDLSQRKKGVRQPRFVFHKETF